ncbi:MAG: hypothetical protein NTY96_13055 [Bacteroidetes bacterium]|nr:hypothetical protein [Bacteroidota bacterium]
MKDNSLSTIGMIRDISSMKSIALSLLNKGKGYDELLAFILKNDYFYNEEAQIPSVKELMQKTGIPYIKLKKYLELIYQDLREQNDPDLLFDIREIV